MRRFSDYDPFAWLYANHWGDLFHRALRAPLEKIFFSELRPRARVLDLCCGDGRLTAALVKRKFQVTGLDGSEEMLTYARERCPATPFLLADVRAFDLPPRFDAVISTFDSLNHVMTTTGLRKAFGNVFKCLKPGGLFVFDLNREEGYRDLWARTVSTVTDHMVSVSRGAYFEDEKLAICDITVLRKYRNAWTRSDFQLRQRLHPRKSILSGLAATGFVAQAYDASELGMTGEIGRGRDFYVARKPY